MKLVSATFCYRCGWDHVPDLGEVTCVRLERPVTLDAFIAHSACVVVRDVLGLPSYAGPWNHHEIALVRALVELLNQSADLDETLVDQELPH